MPGKSEIEASYLTEIGTNSSWRRNKPEFFRQFELAENFGQKSCPNSSSQKIKPKKFCGFELAENFGLKSCLNSSWRRKSADRSAGDELSEKIGRRRRPSQGEQAHRPVAPAETDRARRSAIRLARDGLSRGIAPRGRRGAGESNAGSSGFLPSELVAPQQDRIPASPERP